MNYSLCKLSFSTPFHAGSGDSAKSLDGSEPVFCADTLFSALCHTAAAIDGQEAVTKLCAMAKSGALLLSDTMPYHNDELFVPRPMLVPAVRRESAAFDRKLMKSLRYIPLAALPDYVKFVRSGGEFPWAEVFTAFGSEGLAEKVALSGLPVSSPYSVGTYSFNPGCGLWLLMAAEREDTLDYACRLLVLLGCGGIGGKVSSGYGKFEFAEDPYYFDESTKEYGELCLLQRLLCCDFPCYMSLTTSLPDDDELDSAMAGSTSMVRRRGGFVQSASFKEAAKKKTQFFLAAGSVFCRRYGGGVYSVARGGHDVLRYSRPLFLGVEHI